MLIWILLQLSRRLKLNEISHPLHQLICPTSAIQGRFLKVKILPRISVGGISMVSLSSVVQW
jgi:hypothetical protein